MIRKFKKKRWKKKRSRKHLLPAIKCVHLNEKFLGSNTHHISAEIIIYLPIELHRHDKKNSDENNLIPLSKSNHIRTNTNRLFWNKLFIYSSEIDKWYYEVE